MNDIPAIDKQLGCRYTSKLFLKTKFVGKNMSEKYLDVDGKKETKSPRIFTRSCLNRTRGACAVRLLSYRFSFSRAFLPLALVHDSTVE